MKKRLNKNEIDSLKKSSRVIFILCFLFFIFVVTALIIIVIYGDKLLVKEGNVTYEEKTVDKKEETTKKEKKRVSIDLSDNNITKLFNIVRVTNNTCEGYNIQNNILVKDMSTKCKFSLVSNIYVDDIKTMGNMTYVLEDDVRNAYNYLYGYNSYEVNDSIPYFGVNLSYHATNKLYFTQDIVKDNNNGLISYEKIIDAYREDDSLFIKSISVYYEKVNKIFCSDARCEEIIDTVKNEPSYPDYYDLYVDSRKDKLTKYVYRFDLNEAGFYNYIGYEKTK